jgi:hypothetical protein
VDMAMLTGIEDGTRQLARSINVGVICSCARRFLQ